MVGGWEGTHEDSLLFLYLGGSLMGVFILCKSLQLYN